MKVVEVRNGFQSNMVGNAGVHFQNDFITTVNEYFSFSGVNFQSMTLFPTNVWFFNHHRRGCLFNLISIVEIALQSVFKRFFNIIITGEVLLQSLSPPNRWLDLDDYVWEISWTVIDHTTITLILDLCDYVMRNFINFNQLYIYDSNLKPVV